MVNLILLESQSYVYFILGPGSARMEFAKLIIRYLCLLSINIGAG